MPAVACMRVSMSPCCIHVQQPSHPMPGLTGRPWSIARLLAVQPLGCERGKGQQRDTQLQLSVCIGRSGLGTGSSC